MGVNTVYVGEIYVDGIVPVEFFNYINEFYKTRHITLDNKKIKEKIPGYKECIFDYSLGADGEFFAFKYINLLESDMIKDFKILSGNSR